MKKNIETIIQYLPMIIVLVLWLEPGLAFAADAGTMPWEGPLKKIQEALTGGAARALAIIAMAVAGGMLAFGGELSEFAKRICMVVIAAATMIGAANIINLAVPAAG